ncbi:hypothetical protein J3459_008013 [Metarhizium acridum]|nr:hypothetical protein J3459_008013 [Metarhizium acridum]
MSETKAWEVDTCRGHFHNASGCLFHPHQDLILSAGEDKTIRVWDLNKRTAVQSFKRENDRFWVIAAHPEINLFAAGHDNGVMVFKLERERPASATHQNMLFYITKEKHIKSYDFQKNVESPTLLSLKKLGSPWITPRTLSYNPAEKSVLVTTPAEGGSYELVSLPKDGSGVIEPTEAKRGLAVHLYDIQQKKSTAELSVNGVKYVVWSNDGLYAALLSKHNVTIVTKALEQVSTLHETIRIKSATWDDAGVLLYSTLNHVKYTLLNGDNGIVRTLDQTVYLVRVKGRNVYCLDRAAKPRILQIDPTEYRFKLALIKRNYEEMLHIIRTSSLDPTTRFDLAIECGNLDVAVEMAKELDKPKFWARLSAEALAHGNHQIVEMCYQKLKQFDKLSFLYLATGDHSKLARMAKIAEHRGDFTSRFHNALYLGDVEDRIQMFKEIDLYPLAYMTAKSNGLDDECQAILEATGATEDQLTIPNLGEPLSTPKPLLPTFKANWPTKASSQSFFEKALLGQVEGLSLEDEPATADRLALDEEGDGAPALKRNGGLAEEDDEDVAGWDLGDDDVPEVDSDFVNVDSAEAGGAGSSEADMWARNSPLAVDHAAGGSFESAMQLLIGKVGAVHFAPLKSRFLEVYQASRSFLPASSGLPALVNYVRRTVDETDPRQVLPIIPRDLEHLATNDLQRGYDSMKANKLEEGIKVFKGILHAILVNAVSSEAEVAEAKKLITSAISPPQRHAISCQSKNYNSALSFANRIIANGGSTKIVENARRTKAQCERNPNDAIDIEFDQFAEFEVCAASLTPIYSGTSYEECAFDGSKYHSKYKGSVCRVCEVCEVGKHGSGLKLFA